VEVFVAYECWLSRVNGRGHMRCERRESRRNIFSCEQEVKETSNRVEMMSISSSMLFCRAREDRGPVFQGHEEF
jgi:ribonuclease HI